VKDPNGEGGSWRRYMWRFYWGGLEGKEMKRGACVSAGLLLLALPSFLQFSLSLSSFPKQQRDTSLPAFFIALLCDGSERNTHGLSFFVVAFTIWDFFAMKSCRSWLKIACVDYTWLNAEFHMHFTAKCNVYIPT
jgi:hypothetical protein